MKIQENPPRNHDHEEVESFEGESSESIVESRIEAAEKDIAERAYEEGRKVNEEEKEKVENLRAQITYETSVNRVIEETNAKKPKGNEAWVVPTTQPSKTPWFRRAAMGAMFTLGSLFGMAKESKAAEGAAPVKKATTESVAKNTPSDSTKNTVEVYTKAKTEKGAITPTGLSNSFLENEYGVTPADIDSLANQYGFSTRDEAAFQKDLIEYAQKNDPEIIQYVLNHFGQTEYGIKNKMAPNDYQQLLDGLLGVRAAYIMKFYKDKEEPTENDTETAPYSEYAQDGETMFTPGAGSRAIGELCYPTRKTDDVKKHGGLETSRVAAILRLRDDFGFTGEVVELTADEIQDFFGATKHAKDGDVLAKIKEKAKMIASK